MDIYRLVGKIFKQENDQDEQEAFNQLKSDKRNGRLINELEWIWNNAAQLRPDFATNPEEAWDSFKTRLGLSLGTSSTKIRFIRGAVAVAAILLLVWMFNVLFIQTAPIEVLTTENISKTNLPDGSFVWINKRSRIQYYDEQDTRFVSLRGEAYFEVSAEDDRPFIVEADGLKTEVVGTAFNINERTPLETMVTLFKGRVELCLENSETDRLVLRPGHQGIFNKKAGRLTMRELNDPNVLSWKTGVIVFDDTPMSEVIKALERHYEVRLVSENNQSASRVTGTFDNQTLAEVIDFIKLITDIELELQDVNPQSP